MQKFSQKKYVDPERQSLAEQKEKLRQAKKIWNKSVQQDFVSELIKFKQLLNGRREGGEKIRLYEPLPEEINQNIAYLNNTFVEKMDQANAIVNYQKDYSDKYKKFYGELEAKRQANIGKKSNFEFNQELIKNAVNPYGKIMYNIKSFFNKDLDFKNDIINSLYDIDRAYSKLEFDLLNISDKKSAEAIKTSKDVVFITNKFDYVIQKIHNYRITTESELGKQKYTEPSQRISEVTSLNIDQIYNDINKFTDIQYAYPEAFDKFDKEIINNVNKLRTKINSFRNAESRLADAVKASRIEEIRSLYINVLRKVSLRGMPAFNSFEEIYQYLSRSGYKSAANNENLISIGAVYDPIFRKVRTNIRKSLLWPKIFSKVKGDIKYISSMINHNRLTINDIMENIIEGSDVLTVYASIESARHYHNYIKNSIEGLSSFVTLEFSKRKEEEEEKERSIEEKKKKPQLFEKEKTPSLFSKFLSKRKNKSLK